MIPTGQIIWGTITLLGAVIVMYDGIRNLLYYKRIDKSKISSVDEVVFVITIPYYLFLIFFFVLCGLLQLEVLK